MSTTSIISGLQGAINCAGKCDCCAKLQRQIDNINAKLLAIKPVNELSLKNSIRSSLQPELTTFVAGAVLVATNKLQPQVSSAVEQSRQALERLFRVEKVANNGLSQALKIAQEQGADRAEIARISRLAYTANNTANQSSIVAGTSAKVANSAFNASELAAQKEALLAKQAQEAFRRLNQTDSAIARALQEAELSKGLSIQARGEAGRAVSEAATATKAAANSVSEVSGLRGLVNGLGSRVDAFGRAIANIEAKVGSAITSAAKAVGISEQALGATGRLLGRVAELFQIVGTFATLAENYFTLETLGGRIDAIEREAQFIGNSVSAILGKLLGLQNRIGRNEVTIADTKNIAIDARLAGESARLQAGAAQVTSARAQGIAESALGNARQAQLTADGAVRNAAIANDNATTAYKKANEAQGIGEQAKRVAGDALGKAGVALTTALTAIALYQGVRSLRGLQGIPGIPGKQGERGLQGLPGRDGVTTVVTLPGTPGKDGAPGRDGKPGIPGRNGKDVNPAEAASLRALIISQHTQTRANSTAQHATTRFSILTPIMAALAPIFAVCQQILNVVSAAANTAQLALLNIINSKLGAQVTGGISGLVTSVAQNTYVEKALAVLTFATTLHNALMLTNNLGQTLGSIINTILGLILPKGLDGTPIDIGAVLGKTTTTLIQDAIGTDNYTKLTQEWAMANRIYQASANVFNAITNATSTLINGLEVIGSHTAKIGNALKYWGVLGQKAYEWFHPSPNFHNRYFTFLNNAEAGANTIQAVVQVPVSIVDAKNQIDSANAEFKSAIKGDKNPDGTPKESGIPTEENKDKKDEIEQAKANSQPFSFDFSDLFDGED
ncbi:MULTISPECIES: collagen-like protein [unclassified Nostoc]|uniref:collagen-like triple helix repeat-containing protein n=1 Tax=unclassified Nostoc TaxID=2593658 RepID=UPI002AD54018|nr:collagen-like protein [Nostoc sp. DedQUE03]MDZ7974842.1 collagen-like protein [Nostoc sp. DedQUE03]MDZ8043004.1 collagen-like protein [Nostoc sp. DedQUE02]